MEVKRYTQDLRSNHFHFGDDKPSYTSMNQENFVAWPADPTKADKKALAEDLRSNYLINKLIE